MFSLIRKTQTISRGMSSMASFPIKDEFRLKLLNLDGGSVDLNKDNHSGIATILLNHPEKKNALSGKMMLDLDKCVTDLESWNEGRAVVLGGKGGTFCSGGDLDTVQGLLHGSDGVTMSAFMHNVTSRLHNLPMISVAAISGFALGGGAELTTACDFRIMTESSKIGFVQVKLNLAPGWGGCSRLVNLLGRDKALYLLSSAKMIDASYAERIGYVSQIAPDNCDITDHCKNWLNDNCPTDAGVVGVIKTMVTAATELNRRESLERERQLFSMLWGGEAHLNALSKSLKHKS